jgi:DNA invertase Pin-like site-specific DNA recombinase
MGMTQTTQAKFISYSRVSTDEQGKSGLGIEGQQHAVRQFVENEGGVIVQEFIEIASGDDDNRPQLAAALKLAKRIGAVLVVAKLDRLSRVVAQIAGLIRQGTDLRVVECANASTLELHIRAVIAQEERRMIAARTVAALQAAKRAGVKLGSSRVGHWEGREHLRAKGQQAATAVAAAKRHEMRADTFNAAMPIATKLAADGSSLRHIADTLNAAGITTSRGSAWKAEQVKRMLKAGK